MTNLPLLPVLVPLVAAILILATHRRGVGAARAISAASVALLAASAALLLARAAGGAIDIVALGAWPAPFGIVFVSDRLSAAMVAITAAVAVPALLAATGGTDLMGRHFHPFFQLQLSGLNGAFLTGDLFNLFVFFEVLLIASYGLLAHGGGAARAKAGLHYVALNLTGSVLFLIGLALVYGTLGTLNLADVARRLPLVPAEDQALVRTAFSLLIVVFGLKAAIVPLSFWLPHAYSAATAPVAALFAVMTKVGIYALLRVSATAFAGSAATEDLLSAWLTPLGLVTIVIGTLGVMSATRLAAAVSHLLLLSIGILAAAVGEGGADMVAAALYYLPHTTLVSAALFLLAGWIAAGRGAAGDRLVRGPRIPAAPWVGAAYFALAVAVTGLPPLSGFLGKVMLLTAAPPTLAGYAIWVTFILSGFVAALALARAASTLFWEKPAAPRTDAEGDAQPASVPAGRMTLGLALAMGFVPLLVLGAGPLSAYARAAAEQLMARRPYLEAAMPPGDAPVVRERRP